MTMTSLSDDTTLAAEPVRRPRAVWRREPRFMVEIFDGADDALAALEAVQGGLACNGFQTLNWLTLVYEDLAPALKATPRVVVVTERNSGEVALVLPLIVARKRSLRVARYADLGVADLGAPMLGPALLTKPRSIRRTWRAVRRALHDVDIIRLEKMPREIGERDNPLLRVAKCSPSRKPARVITVPGSFEEFSAALPRPNVNPDWRRVRRNTVDIAPVFSRAVLPEDVARAYSLLDEQRAARFAAAGLAYAASELKFRQFYERLAIDGTEAGFAYIFTLAKGSETIATLFGIRNNASFHVLAMSSHASDPDEPSPARAICLEAIEFFVENGVRRFEFSSGKDPLLTPTLESLGANEELLHDLIIARDLAGLPRAMFHRFRGRFMGRFMGRARESTRLRRLADRFPRFRRA